VANIDPYGIKASQLSADGQVFTGHHLIRKVMVMHSGGSDALVKFYDLDAAPTGGEPYYVINAYGKGITQVDMPSPGMVFFNGLYLDLPVDCVVTTWYEAL
jgi:hypothetical protein